MGPTSQGEWMDVRSPDVSLSPSSPLAGRAGRHAVSSRSPMLSASAMTMKRNIIFVKIRRGN